MAYQDSRCDREVNGKWIYTGSFFHQGQHNKGLPKYFVVHPKYKERLYLAHISLTMLTAPGGDFDEDDTVYADIYSIDKLRMSKLAERETAVVKDCYIGGVWEDIREQGRHHFGTLGDDNNQGISSYVGSINEEIIFRIFIQGDDWVGASYFIMQLT